MVKRIPLPFQSRAMLGAFLSLTTKVAGSASALIIFALAARTMSVAAFGTLVIVFNIASLLAVCAVVGQDTLILRSWGEYATKVPSLARGAVTFGLRVAASGAVVAMLGFVGWAALLDHRLSISALLAVAAFLVSQTLLHYASSLARAVRGSLYSEPPRELVWRAPMIFLLAIVAWRGSSISMAIFFGVAAAGQIAASLFLAGAIRKGFPQHVRDAEPAFLTRAWVGRSGTMAMAALAEAAHQYVDVILIGLLTGPASAAGYFVIIRIANVFPMLTAGLHNYSSSRISVLYYGGGTFELKRLISHVMTLSLFLVISLILVIIVAGSFLLSLFGHQYAVYQPELLMMCAVTGAATLAGPGSMMMLMMGADVIYLKLVVAALGTRVAALVILVPMMGVRGAVIAMGAAVLPFIVAVTLICIRRLRIDPSVFSIVQP